MATTERADQVGDIDVFEAGTTEMSGPFAAAGPLAGGGHSVERSRAELVIARPLFLVRKDVVGVLELLESRFSGLVTRVNVGMVFARSAR